MFEILLSPKKAERRPWEMFFVGLFYASLSVFLVQWIFGKDPVLAKYSGVLIVTLTVIFSLPFMYFTIKYEEKKDLKEDNSFKLLREHSKAIVALCFLFFGFIVAFSALFLIFGASPNFRAQIETFCIINQPANFDACVTGHGIEKSRGLSGFATNTERLFMIFSNNIYVLIFTIIFSLIFGAGAIFILAWNATVIAAAIGIFAKSKLINLPIAIARYMIHGFPEIAAYFVGALAGGIISIAVIRREFKEDKFWDILQDSLNLIIAAVIILIVAALIEVFITPILF